MRANNSTPSTWYVATLVWATIAAVSFVVAPNWHELLAEPAHGQPSGSGTQLQAAPSASAGETSVPAASSVFTERSYPVAEHVQAF